MGFSKPNARRPLRMECLEPRLVLASGLVISEFMAQNKYTLLDDYNQASDWIEIHNTDSQNAVDLTGWYLTDKANNLTQWRFPAASIAAGGYLVVFASGRGVVGPGGKLHTNFQLSKTGEYLALVQADGVTKASEFTPEFPEQQEDISYGLLQNVTTLVSTGAAASYRVPNATDPGGTAWTGVGYDDSSWARAGVKNGVGYDTRGATVAVQLYKSTIAVPTLTAAKQVIATPSLQAWTATEYAPYINYHDNGADGHYTANNRPFPGLASGSNATWYVAEATGNVIIPTAGAWTFGVNSDDGFGLTLSNGTDTFTSKFESTRTAADTLKTFNITTPGAYRLSLIGYQNTAGSEIELFAAQGTYSAYGTTFRLVGDTANGGLKLSPLADAVQTDVRTPMYNVNSSARMRVPFQVASVAGAETLTLRMKYNDGFVAYLNGQEIARSNAPAGVPDWNAAASNAADRSDLDSTIFQDFNVTQYLSLLAPAPATNVLAIQGLSRSAADGTFLATAELTTASTQTDQQYFFSTPTPGASNASAKTLYLVDTNFDHDRGFYTDPFSLAISTPTAGATIYYTLDGSEPAAPKPVSSITAVGTTATVTCIGHGFFSNYTVRIAGAAPAVYNGDFVITKVDADKFTYTLPSAPGAGASGTITARSTACNEYAAPLTINKTTVVRAMAAKTGYVSTNVDTLTYLFLADVVRQCPNPTDKPGPTWPAAGNVSGQSIDYGMDPDIVNSTTWGPQLTAALTQVPTISIVTDAPNLFDATSGIYTHATGSGELWERPASVELINPDGSKGFQIDAGLRIRGGYSRSGGNPKHAFRLFFNNPVDGSLKYPLYGNEGVQEFAKLDFRCSQNYSWSFGGDPNNAIVRDDFEQDTLGALGQPHTLRNPYHLYIDGQYWGLYESEERPEANWAASYFGGTPDDYDVIKVDTGGTGYVGYATDGNMDAWTQLWNMAQAGFYGANADNYYRVQGLDPVTKQRDPNLPVLVNVDNLIDFMITVLYTGDMDGPISNFLGNNSPNNMYAIRSRNSDQGFIFVAHDGEHTLTRADAIAGGQGLANRNGPWSAGTSSVTTSTSQYIHEELMANPEYRMRFADHVQEATRSGGPLDPAVAAARYQARMAQIDLAVIAESARWGDAKRPTAPLTKTDWLTATANDLNLYINPDPATGYPGRSAVLLAQFLATTKLPRNGGGPAPLWPGLNAPTYAVNNAGKYGGTIQPGDVLTMDERTVTSVTRNGTTMTVTLPNHGLVNGEVVHVSGALPLEYNGDFPISLISRTLTSLTYNPATRTATATTAAAHGFVAGDSVVISGADRAPFNGTFVITSATATTFTYATYVTATTTVTATGTVTCTDANRFTYATNLTGQPTGTISARRTAIYYSLDGTTDPRPLGGGPPVVGNGVVQYSGALALTTTTRVKARVYNAASQTWSALSDATYYVDVAPWLRVTELMYNPALATTEEIAAGYSDQDFEFIEIKNINSTRTLPLQAVKFTNGIDFTFPAGSTIGPGQNVVVAADPAAFRLRYPGVNPALLAGPYTGNLNNAGETVELRMGDGDLIEQFAYKDGWYPQTDGGGFSLVVCDPLQALWSARTVSGASLGADGKTVTVTLANHGFAAGDRVVIAGAVQPEYNGDFTVVSASATQFLYTIAGSSTQPTGTMTVFGKEVQSAWQASTAPGGTPGADDVAVLLADSVVINEVLAHTDPPQTDTVEIYNTTSQPIDVGGWFLSDSGTDLTKYKIAAGTVLAGHGYLVLTAAANFGNPADLGCARPFAFGEHGAEVYLSSNYNGQPGGYRQHVAFGATPNGRGGLDIGRWVTSTGEVDFTILSSQAFGDPNSAPYVGPLVVNEVMFNPLPATTAEIAAGYNPNAAGASNNDFEYVELYNRSTSPVTLKADQSGTASKNYYVGGGIGFTSGWYQNHSGTGNTSEVWTLEPGATSTWTKTGVNGTYDVYAHYTVLDGNGKSRKLDDDAQYTISYNGGQVTKTIDQGDPAAYQVDASGNASVYLGRYSFNGTLSVRLTRGATNADKWTIADTIDYRPANQQSIGVTVGSPALDSYWTQHPVTTLAPGAYVVLVSNLAAFNIRYHNQDGHIPVLGTYTGRLANSNDSIHLYQAEEEWDLGVCPYYDYDRVHYYDHSLNGLAPPWPTEPDGNGPGLNRVNKPLYGNDGANWGPSNYLGTPGVANIALDPSPPTVPTGVTATAAVGGLSITVIWNASADAESYVDRYVLYRNGEALATFPATADPSYTYTDSNIQRLVAYSYQVSAINRDQYASALSAASTTGYAEFKSFDVPTTTQINVYYSEPVQPGAGYAVSGRTVQDVVLSEDRLVATLSISAPLVVGSLLTLSITNATTVSGDILPANQQFTFIYQPAGSAGTGTVLREYWLNIPGTAVSDLTGNASYPNNPSGSQAMVTFDATPSFTNWADNYGTRMRGYVCPSSSGWHTFWISADETAELWLSTDEYAANLVKIALVPAFTEAHEWDKYPAQQSQPSWLGAGRKYYIQALQKEGTGNDHLSVTWRRPSDTNFNLVNAKPIAAGNLVPFDIVAPTATGISCVGTSPTGAASVQFSVTFSENVVGVDPADFALAPTGTAAGTVAAVSGSGTSYLVTVNNVTGNGTLGLNLVDNDSITDLSGNVLGGPGAGNGNITGQSYTIDTTPPVAVSVNRNGTSPTNSATLRWNVVFSKSVTGVDTADFRLASTGTITGSIGSVTGSGTSYTVTATVAGAGTAGLNLADDNSIVDTAGNPLNGPGTADPYFTGQVYTVDTTTRPLMYWLKPIAGGTGDYSVSGSYAGGDQDPDHAYAVSINSLPTGSATIKFELYASIGGRDGSATNDIFVAGLLDVFNKPGPSALVGEPSPLSLRAPPFTAGSSSVGQVNGDLDGDGGRDLGGAVSVGSPFPGTNSAWVRPFSTAAPGTSVNANGWTDILVGTISYTFNATGGAAPGQWAQVWTKAVTYTGTSSGFNYAHIWKEDSTTITQRENDGSKIGSGPAVTIAVTSSISVGSAGRQEGTDGTADFVFPVSLSRACPQPVQVTVDTADGTATAADNDYQPLHQVLTFAPGETLKHVTVRVNGDTKVEADDAFFVTLSNPLYNGAAAPSVVLDPSQATGTGTILNDDATAASIAALNADQFEGDSGPASLTFTVGLSAPSVFLTTVQVDTVDGTATVADNDYQALHQTVVFAPGETSKTVTVYVEGDTRVELDETFTLNISNVTGTGASLGSIVAATGTIRNDDAAAALSIVPVDAQKPEGSPGLTAFTFKVTLSNALSSTVTVQVDTADGTATVADSDYQPLHQTLTFSPGETWQIVAVNVVGDTKLENDETFSVSLSNAAGAALPGSNASATGSIGNDDDTIQLGPGGGTMRIACDPASSSTANVFLNGSAAPTYTFPLWKFTQVHIAGGGGDDHVIVDFSNEAPMPERGLAFEGGGSLEGDSLTVEGMHGYLTMNTAVVMMDTGSVVYDNVRFLDFRLQPDPANHLSVDEATLRINRNDALPSDAAVGLVNGGVLDLNGYTPTVRSLEVVRGSVIGGTLNSGPLAVQNSTISAGLAGAGALTKSTAATALLTGNNTYRGGTVVEAGTLLIGNAAAVPAGGDLVIAAGAQVVLPPGMIGEPATAPTSAVAVAALGAETSAPLLWHGLPLLWHGLPTVPPAATEGLPDATRDLPLSSSAQSLPVPLADAATAPTPGLLSQATSLVARNATAAVHSPSPSPHGAAGASAAARPPAIQAKAHDAVLKSLGRATWIDELACLWELQGHGAQRRHRGQGPSSGDAVVSLPALEP